MAITSYPFDSQLTTESQYSKLFRELQDTGIVGSYGDVDLKVTANATGMKVQIAPGLAIIRGHVIWSTDVEELPIDAAGVNTRTDLIVAHLDPATNAITLQVVRGSDLGPTVPAMVQTDVDVYEIALATVTIPPGTVSITADKVSDQRTYTGQRIGSWRTATRPASPRIAKLGWNADVLGFEVWDGTAWSSLTVPWTAVSGKPATFPPSSHFHNFGDIHSGFNYQVGDIPPSSKVNDNVTLKTVSAVVPFAGSTVIIAFTGQAGFLSADGTVWVDLTGSAGTASYNTNGGQTYGKTGQYATVAAKAIYRNVPAGTFIATFKSSASGAAFYNGIAEVTVQPTFATSWP